MGDLVRVLFELGRLLLAVREIIEVCNFGGETRERFWGMLDEICCLSANLCTQAV